MRSFGRLLERCLVLAAIAVVFPSAARPEVSPHQSRIIFDAPGHVAVEGAPVVARGGEPGATWRIADWRGREVEGAVGAFDKRGEATLPPLPAGYYRMAGTTLAVVSPILPQPPRGVAGSPRRGAEGGASFFAADSAASYIAKGAFDCPWNDGDAIRTIADLAQLAGIRHIRERMRWLDAQPAPDAPPDFSRCLAAADLFHERGIAISGCFHDCPGWAGILQKLPGDLAALYRFCRETADAFGDRMEDWEFWNEPDIHFAPEPVWDYAAALKAAYLGFKAARPDMPVLNGSLSREPSSAYEKALFANDAALCFDTFNYHTYAALSQYPDIFARLRESLDAAGVGDRPVWITECGTNNEGPATEKSARPGFTAHSPGQELVVAEYGAKANISLQMEGMARNYLFILGAYSERGGRKDWGMIRRDGTAKPAFAALATQIRELGDATLLGRMDAPEGIRAYLYEQPDGSQTVAFWAESPLDNAASSSDVIEAEPDCARDWVLDPAEPASATLRLVDMCGTVSAAAQDVSGALRLPATRFPSYATGLRGLRAGLRPASLSLAPARPEADLSVVLRVDLAPGEFEIGAQKTLAVAKGDAPHLRVQAWNLCDTANIGLVEAEGVALEGLPAEPFELAPFGSAEFDCVLRPDVAGADPVAHISTLVLRGRFNGLPSSRLSMSVLFEKPLLASCETEPIDWRDPARWQRNDSASSYSVAWDEAEQAIRFEVAWDDPRTDRWFYPLLPLELPRESFECAWRVAFDVKTAQDKVENDFNNNACHLMLVRGGKPESREDWLSYTPPTGSWERRYVELYTSPDLGEVEAIRLGANPLGMRLTFWIRDLVLLKGVAPSVRGQAPIFP